MKLLRLAAFLLLAVSLSAADKTNVLFIMADDLNCDLSIYGNTVIRTPNFERLARRGVVFERAYCQYPVCNPSRSSLMTGLYPDQTGVISNGSNFRKTIPDVVTMPQMFRNNGYFAARVGKIYHYGVPGQIGTSGVDDPASWEQVVNPKGRDKLVEPLIFSIGKPGDFGGTLSWLADDGLEEEQTDAIGAAAMVDLLESHKDEPFFLAMGFYRPHTPYVAPRKYFDLYPIISKIRLPDEPADDLLDVPAAAWVQRIYQDQIGDRTKMEAIQAYYAAISLMDAQLGKILDTLDRLELWDDTVVVMTSDHGYHMGEHQLWQKTTLFENSDHVPLVIAAPGFEQTRGRRSGAVAELVDLYPTLADLAGLQAPPHVMGVSLRKQLNDVNAPGKTAALTVFDSQDRLHPSGPHHPKAHSYSIRTERWRYTEWGPRGRQGVELYDHLADPHEFTNHAEDPDYLEQVRMLSDRLATERGRATSKPKLR
ncbi:MAG: sulfatase-like hydrolase/transferase [Acidobacteria bacterium]|nr:sulfatase-like hydrolase/transferase [Acidobacteriota bacterium]